MAEPVKQSYADSPLEQLQQARRRLMDEHGHLLEGRASGQADEAGGFGSPHTPAADEAQRIFGAQSTSREQPAAQPAPEHVDAQHHSVSQGFGGLEQQSAHVQMAQQTAVQPAQQAESAPQVSVQQQPAVAAQQIDIAAWLTAIQQLDETNLQTLLRHLPARQLVKALSLIIEQQTQTAQVAPSSVMPPAVQPQAGQQQVAQPQDAAAVQHAVPEHKGDTEDRRSERQKTLRGGKIIFNNKMSVADCQIRDISEIGCRLHCESANTVPNYFTLHIVHGDMRRECQVMWRKDKQMGVQFIG